MIENLARPIRTDTHHVALGGLRYAVSTPAGADADGGISRRVEIQVQEPLEEFVVWAVHEAKNDALRRPA